MSCLNLLLKLLHKIIALENCVEDNWLVIWHSSTCYHFSYVLCLITFNILLSLLTFLLSHYCIILPILSHQLFGHMICSQQLINILGLLNHWQKYYSHKPNNTWRAKYGEHTTLHMTNTVLFVCWLAPVFAYYTLPR